MFFLGEFFNFRWRLPELEDLSALKDKGEYSEETEEKGNSVTKKVSFKSFDGSRQIYRETTTPKGYEKFADLWELERKLEHATIHEDFEQAARLRDQRNDLRKELKELKEQKRLDNKKK